MFERGEDAVVFFADGEALGEGPDGGVEGLRFVVAAGFEDDADGIFGEALLEVERKEDGEFKLGSIWRRVFYEPSR